MFLFIEICNEDERSLARPVVFGAMENYCPIVDSYCDKVDVNTPNMCLLHLP
jgi:hypothetical protein